jgi:hypothetical protein
MSRDLAESELSTEDTCCGGGVPGCKEQGARSKEQRAISYKFRTGRGVNEEVNGNSRQ